MTDREKLLKLFEQFYFTCYTSCKTDSALKNCKECQHEQLADYLLEKGVVVLPCKVGDTVWIILGEDEIIKDFEILNVITSRDRITLTFTNKSCFTIWNGYCGDYFGKSISLTYEEAEKALREREKNGNT